jgi:hypothetical protein
LLIAAYFLAGAGRHYAFRYPYFHFGFHRFGYYHYGYVSSYYEEGVYFERLRAIVCTAWLFAAFRFYVLRWYAVAIVGTVIAWLFNPIFPVTMSRVQWQPYDHWTMLVSIATAIALVCLSVLKNRTVGPPPRLVK